MALFSSAPEEAVNDKDAKKQAKKEAKEKKELEKKEKKEGKTHRPSTSNTANVLLSTRQQASENYLKAQQAERAYVTRKKVTAARANYENTTTHFKEGFKHLAKGIKGLFSAIAAIPWLISERKEKRRLAQQEAMRKRNLEKKKKLEEELAKHEEA